MIPEETGAPSHHANMPMRAGYVMAGIQPLDVPEEKTSLIPVQGHMGKGDINNNDGVKPKRP